MSRDRIWSQVRISDLVLGSDLEPKEVDVKFRVGFLYQGWVSNWIFVSNLDWRFRVRSQIRDGSWVGSRGWVVCLVLGLESRPIFRVVFKFECLKHILVQHVESRIEYQVYILHRVVVLCPGSGHVSILGPMSRVVV